MTHLGKHLTEEHKQKIRERVSEKRKEAPERSENLQHMLNFARSLGMDLTLKDFKFTVKQVVANKQRKKRKLTEEHIQKIRERNKLRAGKKRKPLSEEHKESLSKALMGKQHKKKGLQAEGPKEASSSKG